MVVTVFRRFYYHLPPLAEDAVRTPRSVAKYFDFLDLFRLFEGVFVEYQPTRLRRVSSKQIQRKTCSLP